MALTAIRTAAGSASNLEVSMSVLSTIICNRCVAQTGVRPHPTIGGKLVVCHDCEGTGRVDKDGPKHSNTQLGNVQGEPGLWPNSPGSW